MGGVGAVTELARSLARKGGGARGGLRASSSERGWLARSLKGVGGGSLARSSYRASGRPGGGGRREARSLARGERASTRASEPACVHVARGAWEAHLARSSASRMTERCAPGLGVTKRHLQLLQGKALVLSRNVLLRPSMGHYRGDQPEDWRALSPELVLNPACVKL
jgi:hypothetical protein